MASPAKRCYDRLPMMTVVATFALALAQDWEPARTWVFMVGILEWKDSASYEGFPKKDRRDEELRTLLLRRGVPEQQILFLKDKEATQARIRKEFADFLGKADGTLFVYYAGHGNRDDRGTAYFIPYDAEGPTESAGWSVPSIFDELAKRFKGSRTLLLADCCYSGALSVEARNRKADVLCLASSQSSAESTGNWTFTEGLLAGFRGDAAVDVDGDGRVRLEELSEVVEKDLAFSEGQLSSFHAPGGGGGLVLAGAGRKKSPREGERLEVRTDGAWHPAWVLEAEKTRLKVRYAGTPEGSEWVEPDRTRAWKPAHHAPGARVEVRWKRKWFPSTILEGKLGVHRVHYEGFGDESDEWVEQKRIRP